MVRRDSSTRFNATTSVTTGEVLAHVLKVTWFARTNRAPGHPFSIPLNYTHEKGGEIQVDDPERGMLGAEAHKRNVRSKFR